jgi:hypothetical protein
VIFKCSFPRTACIYGLFCVREIEGNDDKPKIDFDKNDGNVINDFDRNDDKPKNDFDKNDGNAINDFNRNDENPKNEID